jgi:hypothetical protein
MLRHPGGGGPPHLQMLVENAESGDHANPKHWRCARPRARSPRATGNPAHGSRSLLRMQNLETMPIPNAGDAPGLGRGAQGRRENPAHGNRNLLRMQNLETMPIPNAGDAPGLGRGAQGRRETRHTAASTCCGCRIWRPCQSQTLEMRPASGAEPKGDGKPGTRQPQLVENAASGDHFSPRTGDAPGLGRGAQGRRETRNTQPPIGAVAPRWPADLACGRGQPSGSPVPIRDCCAMAMIGLAFSGLYHQGFINPGLRPGLICRAPLTLGEAVAKARPYSGGKTFLTASR